MGGYGVVSISTDGGTSWSTKTPPGTSGSYSAITVDSAGAKIYVCNKDANIHASSDFGDTWTTQATARAWTGIAAAALGYQVAACADGDQIYVSHNSGGTWSAKAASRSWTAIASSADGRVLAATVNGDQIYMSYDNGETWVPRSVSRAWKGIAMSPDGTKLIAGASGGDAGAYYSTDSGMTWKTLIGGGGSAFAALAISADGGQVVMGQFSSYLWRQVSFPGKAYTSAGPSYHLGGGPCTAVELQYVGNNTFVPISYVGSLGFD